MRKLFFFFTLFILFSCDDEFSFDDALISTGDILQIDDTGAVFSARIAHRGKYEIIESGFIWNIKSNTGDGIKLKNPDNSLDKFSLPTGYPLVDNQTYSVKAYIKTAHKTTYGSTLVFEGNKKDEATTPWPITLDSHPSSTTGVRSSFNLNTTTYFLGIGIYAFNHITKKLSYIVKNDITQHSNFSVAYSQNGFIFSQDRFYKFNPDNLLFTPLAEVPSDFGGSTGKGFLIDDDIFVSSQNPLTYAENLFRYNIPTNTWKKMSTPPLHALLFPSLSDQNIAYGFYGGYVGGDSKFHLNFWIYNRNEDVWKKGQNLSGLFYLNSYAHCPTYPVTRNGHQYLYNNFALYEFVPGFNTWIEVTRGKFTYCYNLSHAFAYNDSIFVIRIQSENAFTLWTYAG